MHNKEKSETECTALLEKIFPPPEVLLAKFAPEGWETSPLYLAVHPSPQELFERATIMHNNLNRMLTARGKAPSEPPRLDDYLSRDDSPGSSAREEILQLFGDCVWSVFSENHDVVAPDAVVYHLGSWRGTGSTIADFINKHYWENDRFDYIDFYMGLHYEEDRKKCLSVFVHIFEILKQEGCDWRYDFPGLGLVSFAQPPQAGSDPATYDPAKAMQAEMEYEAKQREIADLQAQFDKDREDAMENALYEPPPAVVQAYWQVYGWWPEGWVVGNG